MQREHWHTLKCVLSSASFPDADDVPTNVLAMPTTELNGMNKDVRDNFSMEMRRLSEGLKTVIESGANLACLCFELFLTAMEGNSRPRQTFGKSENGEDILTAKEAAQILRVTEKTVYNWAERGIIRYLKYGDEKRYLRCQLLEDGRRQETSQKTFDVVNYGRSECGCNQHPTEGACSNGSLQTR